MQNPEAPSHDPSAHDASNKLSYVPKMESSIEVRGCTIARYEGDIVTTEWHPENNTLSSDDGVAATEALCRTLKAMEAEGHPARGIVVTMPKGMKTTMGRVDVIVSIIKTPYREYGGKTLINALMDSAPKGHIYGVNLPLMISVAVDLPKRLVGIEVPLKTAPSLESALQTIHNQT